MGKDRAFLLTPPGLGEPASRVPVGQRDTEPLWEVPAVPRLEWDKHILGWGCRDRRFPVDCWSSGQQRGVAVSPGVWQGPRSKKPTAQGVTGHATTVPVPWCLSQLGDSDTSPSLSAGSGAGVCGFPGQGWGKPTGAVG